MVPVRSALARPAQVDDLVVNEEPMAYYTKADVELSPDYQKCYDVLLDADKAAIASPEQPDGVEYKVWIECQLIKKQAEGMKENEDYIKVQAKSGEGFEYIRLARDMTGKPIVPKEPLTADWGH